MASCGKLVKRCKTLSVTTKVIAWRFFLKIRTHVSLVKLTSKRTNRYGAVVSFSGFGPISI